MKTHIMNGSSAAAQAGLSHSSSTKSVLITNHETLINGSSQPHPYQTSHNDAYSTGENEENDDGKEALEKSLVRKVNWRLCTIAGILCSLNLLDSGIISSASVTSIFADLGLGVGNRYVSFDL